MITLGYSREKTNSYRPDPWNFTKEPFPSYRGEGQSHKAFLATAKGYTPDFDRKYNGDSYYSPNIVIDRNKSKIIKTKEKGTDLLVPVDKEEDDEKILLLTLRGGFRGYYSKIENILNTEIISRRESSSHCVEVNHVIARVKDQSSYILAETGRRSGSGIVEIFGWDFYKTMTSDEYKGLVDIYQEEALNILRNG